MASKSKRRSKGRTAANPIDRVKRNLDRGDFKQALKDARVCYRQSPTPDCRCFLEHAYIGRAQQLMQNGLIEDSRRIARDLLDLGVTEPAVEAGLPDLLLSVGMFDCLPQGNDALAGDQRDRLLVKAADQAVVRPGNTPESMTEVRENARQIRAALEAVERGDESAALEHLGDIPRQSLFADWKFFVRGLIAYYKRDRTRAASNWDRLDADRAAARIAAPLKAIVGMAPSPDDDNLHSEVSRLMNQVSNGAILNKLTRLRQAAADRDWPLLFNTLRLGRQSLQETDEVVYQRLVACLCGVFVRDGLVEELDQLSRIVDPMPLDPRWNRAKAVASECSEFHDDDPEHYWRKYLCDLENLPVLSPAQRDLARGLVWCRLAEYYVDDAHELRTCRCGANHEHETTEAENQAQDAFEHCFRLAPALTRPYVAAADFHKDADRPEKAAKVYQRLLEHVPDDLDALFALAKHHVSHGEGLRAREFAQRARELKPLDAKTGELLWAAHTEAACELTQAKQYDKARGELETADRLQPALKDDFDVLARKAVLEIDAGDRDAAKRFVEQAQEQLQEPTALWLTMTIESIRHDLSWHEEALYEKRWHQALKRRCNGETAGAMCRVLGAHLRRPQPYSRNEEHRRSLLHYVGRCSRVKWRAEDLRHVCEFLEPLEEHELLKKFAKKGRKKFPKLGCFHWWMGICEMSKGPFRFKRQVAIQEFRQAIELASKSSDPRDKKTVEYAKRFLDVAENASPHHYKSRDYPEDVHGDPVDYSVGEFRDVVEAVAAELDMNPETILDLIGDEGPSKLR